MISCHDHHGTHLSIGRRNLLCRCLYFPLDLHRRLQGADHGLYGAGCGLGYGGLDGLDALGDSVSALAVEDAVVDAPLLVLDDDAAAAVVAALVFVHFERGLAAVVVILVIIIIGCRGALSRRSSRRSCPLLSCFPCLSAPSGDGVPSASC